MLFLIIPIIFFLFAIVYMIVARQKQQDPLDKLASWPYERRQQLLNPLELTFYRVMREHLHPGMIILPKVRLQNLVYVSPNSKLADKLEGKLSDKYLDFTICDAEDFSLICVIEFNDEVDTDKDVSDMADIEKILDAAHLYLYTYSPQYEYSEADFAIINQLYAHFKSNQ